ncbi:MAG TPA: transglycosylase SLT domain-containing protein [Stellaceae bacterium]|nr:transglycosylase SLT domain-containing protein [Stellaceae bacterium]
MQRHALQWWRLGLAIIASVLSLSMVARASEPVSSRQLVCQTIEQAAAANGLPGGFLARLLWIESRFHAAAISPAGALGIAQFMPQTAARRGLANPWDPLQAITEAARLLADLKARFGNLGLAAAAYNAGAERVAAWLRGAGALAPETQVYVLDITGRRANDWALLPGSASGTYDSSLSGFDCLGAQDSNLPKSASRPAEPQWQVRLALGLAQAIDRFNAANGKDGRTRSRIIVSSQPYSEARRAANSLCETLRASGAACEVFDP